MGEELASVFGFDIDEGVAEHGRRIVHVGGRKDERCCFRPDNLHGLLKFPAGSNWKPCFVKPQLLFEPRVARDKPAYGRIGRVIGRIKKRAQRCPKLGLRIIFSIRGEKKARVVDDALKAGERLFVVQQDMPVAALRELLLLSLLKQVLDIGRICAKDMINSGSTAENSR